MNSHPALSSTKRFYNNGMCIKHTKNIYGKYFKLILCIIPFLLLYVLNSASFAESTEEPITFSDIEKTWLAGHKTIRLAYDGYFPPFSFLNDSGQVEGLAVDFIRVLTERAGINIETYSNAT